MTRRESDVEASDPGTAGRGVPGPPEEVPVVGSTREAETRTYVVTIQHPAHVHFFRHAIEELQSAGHAVHVFVRENEVAVDLLETYGIDHEVLAGEASGLPSLAAVQATYELRLFRAVRRIDPDVMAAIGGVAAAHVGSLLGVRTVVFTDTEHATVVNGLAFPFADAVCTPACFRKEVGEKRISYPGYHELAYLHPDRFAPDPTVPAEAGLSPDEPFVVLRVGAWDSSHDFGQGGFADVRDAVERLEAAGARAVVTSEVPLPDDLERCRLSVRPHRIHHLLYYADCYVGEGATMAAESAVLGTPAVYVNTLEMGYTADLEEYGLLYHFRGDRRHERALSKAEAVLEHEDTGRWRRRRERLAAEKVDTTDVVLDVLTGT